MEPLEKSMYDMVKENNVLLHKINHREKVRNFFAIAKMVLLIALAVISYIYIQPYLERLMEMYQTISEGSQQVKDFGATFQLNPDAFKDFFTQ